MAYLKIKYNFKNVIFKLDTINPIMPKRTGDVNNPTIVNTQARTLTPIPAMFLFLKAMTVLNIATIAANETNINPRKRIPRTAKTQLITPAIIPAFFWHFLVIPPYQLQQGINSKCRCDNKKGWNSG